MAGVEKDGIYVSGAREHNLKNIDAFIPRNKITVVTGLSGSGKSSLCFDTIYAEGQRRYIEGLSTFARNFLNQLKKPEVDSISGLSPSISIEQKTNSLSPRSTVGTVTEINDYLRLLFARVGSPYCPNCDIPVSSQNSEQIIDEICSYKSGTKICILAPVASGKKGEFSKEFQKWLRLGYVRARVDGEYIELEKANKLAKTKAHNIELVIDRVIIKDDVRTRVSQSVNSALALAGGHLIVQNFENKEEQLYSQHASCVECGFNFPEIEPRLFSFNNPRGACEECNGLGYIETLVEEVGSKRRSGDDEESLDDVETENTPCEKCDTTRLKKVSRSVFLGTKSSRKNIADLNHMAAPELRLFLQKLSWTKQQETISSKILEQVYHRLKYMSRVGIDYLSMDRATNTLSGGEAQRVRLSAQLGSSLIGVLYVLDEPSIGLHPRDHNRLLELLQEIRDHGNTILMVEHDEDTIRDADLVLDLGPRAGVLGGSVQAVGTPGEIQKNTKSLTGKYLSGAERVFVERAPQKFSKWLELKGACSNNLKNVNLKIPVGSFSCVTGVSGSGKSTLIIDTLSRAMKNVVYKTNISAGKYDSITGAENFDKVIHITQSPIGRTPRSNPSTYIGLFSSIRDLFTAHPESRLRGWKPGRFSFNVKGGRCEECLGVGQKKIEMHFMADVYVPCDSCNGQRYNFETLKVRYKNKSIADVLSMTVEESLDFFRNHPSIYSKVETLHRVGLDYLTLGQSCTTLSGGESQRIKLSKELSRRATGKTLYILDEPTTGLHFEDIRKLLDLLHELAAAGNTVIVIEHNLDVISSADYVVDLGPEGGVGGGHIVACGHPREILSTANVSHTAKYLKKKFGL